MNSMNKFVTNFVLAKPSHSISIYLVSLYRCISILHAINTAQRDRILFVS